jgi:hypothetical protein
VKDRSVAVYLKKMLHGNKPDNTPIKINLNEGYMDLETNNSDYICEGLLNSNLFKIGFAMGLKRMSLIN